MKISFLQAYDGDCIHMEHDGHHVVIDGGPKCEELEEVIKKIVSNHEKIDLQNYHISCDGQRCFEF